MTDPTVPTDKPQLDHDGDGRAGGSKPPAKVKVDLPTPVWIVTRRLGLIAIAGEAVAAGLAGGGRYATQRDLDVAGVETSEARLATEDERAAAVSALA